MTSESGSRMVCAVNDDVTSKQRCVEKNGETNSNLDRKVLQQKKPSTTVPPIIMEVENGCISVISFLSF